jgi:hypothetical protein
MGHRLVEQRDADIEKLRASYKPKFDALKERQRKAQQRIQKEKQEAKGEWFQTMVSTGGWLLNSILGGRRRSPTTAMRGAGRIAKQRQDVEQAQESAEAVDKQLADMETELQAKVEVIRKECEPTTLEISEVAIQPRKGDLAIARVVLAWTPWYRTATGQYERAW